MILSSAALAAPLLAAAPGGVQEARVFEGEIPKIARLEYLLHLPADYDADGDASPLILFLHGAGERGDDLEKVKVHGIAKIAEAQADFPFIAVSPQCPTRSWWTGEVEALEALLAEVIETHNVDESRVYLTGLSMGGFGSWALAIRNPSLFAAIAPVCGGGEPEKVAAIKDLPVWNFHGAKDTVVEPERSQTMVDALEAAGGDVKYTLHPEANHDSWTVTYDNPELYEWFLSHRNVY
ncbi:phospholipase [Candidatus Poribacteria bacterium]|nr:phospholipase [Candidatus Poribacteria bacterium]